MISSITKNIIIRALKIRRDRGEDPGEAIRNYKNLTDEDKKEILEQLEGA